MNDDRHLHDSELRASSPDDALRGRFAALRREEEQQVPEFASLWRPRARASRRKAVWFLAAACAFIVGAALLWQLSTERRPQDVPVASITEWKAPTDFLLETPGHELLRTVPEIGRWRGYTEAVPKARPSAVRKKSLH